MARLRFRARVAIIAGAIVFACALPPVAAAAEITSDGPLTRIIVTPDLNCQVAHEADLSFEFFGSDVGACGTFLAVGGSLYGPPAIAPSGPAGLVPWTPVSQTDDDGLVTIADAGASGIRIEQRDSYQVGEESYRTDIRISNSGGSEQRAVLYRAADCFLQDSDTGFGRVDDEAPACVISQEADARIEQWVPITPGSSCLEQSLAEVWSSIGSQQPFPNTCRCNEAVDNGAGLSWDVVIPAGGSVDVSHLTFFSPEGRRPTVPLRDSVPGPADISLDPLVVATSLAVSAGVVVLVPFPAALFNSTLEENYEEVTGAIGRLRRWFGRLFGGLFAAVAGRLRRAPPGTQAASSGGRFKLDDTFWRSPRGILTFIGVSALLYGLLDPTFGLSVESLATVVGLVIGLGVMLLAFAVPTFIGGRRSGVGVQVRALPGTLLVAIGCVIISRIADFQPGYLYGLIIGFIFSRELAKADAGRIDAFAAGSALALAVVSWLLLPGVREGASEGTFSAVLLETAFATVVVAGLEAAAISMLPLRFMPGERVRSWNPRVWMALLGIAALGFFHILVNPSSGYLADSTRSSLVTVILLLAVFGGGSGLFWAYFRYRPRRESAAAEPPPPLPGPPA